MTYLDMLKAKIAEKGLGDIGTKGTKPPFGTFVPKSDGRILREAALKPHAPRGQSVAHDNSAFDVRDDDDGWIGESPRQTRLRLIRGGRTDG